MNKEIFLNMLISAGIPVEEGPNPEAYVRRVPDVHSYLVVRDSPPHSGIDDQYSQWFFDEEGEFLALEHIG